MALIYDDRHPTLQFSAGDDLAIPGDMYMLYVAFRFGQLDAT